MIIMESKFNYLFIIVFILCSLRCAYLSTPELAAVAAGVNPLAAGRYGSLYGVGRYGTGVL